MKSAQTTRRAVQAPTPEEFRHVIGHFLSGVTVVTTSLDGRQFGTTASAVTSVSLEPPTLLVCLNRTSETGAAIARSDRFAVNILAESQGALASMFASKGADKFAGAEPIEGPGGLPLLEAALASVECRVLSTAAAGTHTVFIGEVMSARSRDGEPLAYFRSRFGRFVRAEENGARNSV